jgi:hypothetical protein
MNYSIVTYTVEQRKVHEYRCDIHKACSHRNYAGVPWRYSQSLWVLTTDISQYRLRFGSSLLYKSVFHLNSLPAQLSYEGRVAVVGAK